MQTLGQTKKPAAKQSGINPFAQALVETESHAHQARQETGKNESQLFSEALAKTGGNLEPKGKNSSQNDLLAQQQAELKKQAERDALRKKLHDQINPVDNHEIYAARQERELKEINQLKKEIALLMSDLGSLQKEAEVTLMTQITQPGQEGSYYKNFFAKLRSFIMLLRQKVKSARTWAKQMNSRKKKMSQRRGGGMVVDSQETKFVQDTMHHEKSTAFSGS
ncbi:MAG: hypothetical protein COU63_04285 [Candidatus Pacebacteria bacterium CG10_big_fil_rev_8_21_14_0_10_36_11]|nr:hypothetical protein [Candidatus Pacearchaeota archaeon]OIP74112.1 MAG: hypothetical protein AUK08_02560 [Candidatus Pacebacteria bacterium CG2_30_36_39]PIR64480.1 MAG: hypothetical protein COU63_04285 [Candidatus Pacebacteria bacterium CG10_big_fil_rev_8_21_14_0_10_36_11]PJC42974.1 MAG: hypothetical protein CO040_01655 [Candidatus Pacebacteria bacterium CG_4_9_14_0_2_um_filter_36_8]